LTEINLIISGQPVTKKNSQRLIYNKNRIIPIPSAAYKTYEAMALRQLYAQYNGAPIDYPVNLSCVYYLARRYRGDLVGWLQATQDILVKAKVIADDNYKIVARLNDSRVDYDKANPRVEITISELLPFEE
jgi:Holliday junction resolvase RusA-like endonuclease